MANIDDLARGIARDLSPEFEKRLRDALAQADREWLVDELVRLTLSRHRLEDLERDGAATALLRAERLQRVVRLKLDESAIKRFIGDNEGRDREKLIADGYLNADAPEKGAALLSDEHRTPQGSTLLIGAKDMLFGLLFGDNATGTQLDRVQQELLTLALPRAKAGALDFMRASTELAAEGTWQDPESVSNDESADNVLLEVQFGETADELVGRGIVTALSLINSLEVNEQILYARMINVEESTLIP
ncbi:MAG TPA: hypothetical protein VM284_07550 [Candidatus Limnocylindria bacterium]|nr:hypothetical protein [Candidatus Limnocylindria bacterium]